MLHVSLCRLPGFISVPAIQNCDLTIMYNGMMISGLFVDVGDNTSILDRINLTFPYDDIGQKGQSAEEEENAVSSN